MLKRMKKDTFLAWVVFLVLFVVYGIVGEMDYQDAVKTAGKYGSGSITVVNK